MKIAFVYDCAYPFIKGGAEKRIFEYAGFLGNTEKVEIICMQWWFGEKKYIDDNLTYIGICSSRDLYDKNGKRKILPGVYFGIKVAWYLFKNRYDILDFEVFPYFPIIFTKLFFLFKNKKPKIIGYWSEYIGKGGWKKYNVNFWWLGVMLEKISFYCCDKIIANSFFTQDRLLREFRDAKIRVINPTGIDIKFIENISDPVNKIYDIIYFGRLIKHKNIEKIIEIGKINYLQGNNIQILIIGNGPDEKKIKGLVDKNNLKNSITFVGFVDNYANLIKLIKSSKIMIFPSKREGFGISVVEANACKLPVLVLDYPDNAAKELIKDGFNGFVCRNGKDLYEKAMFLLDQKNNNVFLKISMNSHEYSKKYSRETTRARVLNFYKTYEDLHDN